MKFNFVTTLIAIAMSALIAYGFYSFNNNTNKELLAYTSFFMLGFMLLFIIGKRYDYYPDAVNVRVVSLVFFAIVLTSNIFFSFLEFTLPSYIVVHGIVFLLYLLIIYFLFRKRI